MSILRCYSCCHYTISRCLKDRSAWPDAKLDECPDASFEPGTGPVEFGGEAEYLEAIKQ